MAGLRPCLHESRETRQASASRQSTTQADRITTRKDLATFLDALSAGGIEHGTQSENLQIFDMLEAMAAWLLRVVLRKSEPLTLSS
jgi:hypothetical protein